MDIFCKIANGELPANVVMEDEDVMVIMDAYPFTPGHVLIIPKKHYTTIVDMDESIITKIHMHAKNMISIMEKSYEHLESIKLVVNYGEEQKVKHYHLHLLPIYKEGKKPSLTQEECCALLKK